MTSKICAVVYKSLGITVTREMTQKQLSQLLLDEEIELVSVNAHQITHIKKKKGR